MAQALQTVPPEAVITGWDFSTGAVKCLAFDLDGNTLGQVRFPTDLWTEGGVSELNLMQLEGQAMATTRAMARLLGDMGRLKDWVAGGISATHHTSGRIDKDYGQIRRAICWNDHTLGEYHAQGLARLGGQEMARQLIGGPWAIRYSLSHFLKDEKKLPSKDWQNTYRILGHGPLAAGFLTGNFTVTCVSAAASTGIMDLRTNQWCQGMLSALESPEYQELAWNQLPVILDQFNPVGRVRASLLGDGLGALAKAPWIFPTSDDQQAGLVGGGAVDDGQVAIILGNSAVVNSSSSQIPQGDGLDAMKLNWGPYLWMRCYNNGAQFLDRVVGANPDWAFLEKEARQVPPGCEGVQVIPFIAPEPSLGVKAPRMEWLPGPVSGEGKKFRASLEALAYLIALGVKAHEEAGQKIQRITVSGGISRSTLMGEILASVLQQPLHRLVSEEGPALGAAVTALATVETYQRRQQGNFTPFTVGDAVARMVRFSGVINPRPEWVEAYKLGLNQFAENLKK